MEKETTIAVDLGNTLVKIAYFINSELGRVEKWSWSEFIQNEELINKLKNFQGICSSVLSEDQNMQLQDLLPKLVFMNENTKLPFKVDYKTPQTLGKDRLCNAVAGFYGAKNQNVLIIDVGTCIKYDFLSMDGTYHGGAISPGIHLRYKSLNDYTAKLPLIDNTDEVQLIGKSTIEAIHSGVMNGMKAEIIQIIEQYQCKYESLTIFVTGGDAIYFDLHSKNNIFANKNLTLEGLFQIYLFNVQ